MYLFSLILTSFVLSRVLGTLTPSDSVSIDCGGQQTFTCTVAGTAAWTITGLMGITVTGSTGGGVAIASARVTTPDMGLGPTSIITITGFNTSDNGGTVQCADIGSGVPLIDGMATIAVVSTTLASATAVMANVDQCSANLTWSEPSDSSVNTSVSCTPPSPQCSSCTSSGCTIGGLTHSTSYTFSVNRSRSGCDDSTAVSSAVTAGGLPQCGQVGLEFGGDKLCPLFTFTPGIIEPTFVNILYQLRSSSEETLRCPYPFVANSCSLNLQEGNYTFMFNPENGCGISNSCSSTSQTLPIPANCTIGIVSIQLSPAELGGIIVAGIIVILVAGFVIYFLVLFILARKCYSSIGFCGLLKCKCFNGKARRSSSKQRIGSASPVTPPAQPPAQPPADEYADPQAIRDRKESGKEDKDKIQYAAIDFSAGAGSGAGEVKIHQKEEPVIYTAVQHV